MDGVVVPRPRYGCYSAWALDLPTDAGVPAGSEAPPPVEAGDRSELMKLLKYLFSLT